jgi:hypothetical protein
VFWTSKSIEANNFGDFVVSMYLQFWQNVGSTFEVFLYASKVNPFAGRVLSSQNSSIETRTRTQPCTMFFLLAEMGPWKIRLEGMFLL